jgi:carboxypeptidase T
MMKRKIGSMIVCILFFTVVFSVGTSGSTTNEDTLVLAKIGDTNYNFLATNNFEIVGSQPGSLFVIIPTSSLRILEAQGIGYEIVIQDVQAYENGVRGQYHTLAQIESILQTIASDYPSITSLYSIGTTYEGRSIWCLEISDNPGVDEGEPGVLLIGLHHAREWPSVEICLYIANELTSNYGSDPDITDVVNSNRIWLVTCMNPDGYYYCHDQSHDWRKNRDPYPGGIGVDVNRNYGGSSDGNPWGSWGSVFDSAATHDPSQEVFCGGGPFSEAETQAIRNLVINNDICAGISYHTFGELVLWPWGYTTAGAPDSTYLTQIGQGIASKITQQDGSGTYTPQQSDQLYPTTGDFLDWTYGYGYYVQGRPAFVYTVEACQSFQPSASYLDQICQENFDGALYLLQQAGTIKETVSSRVMPPVIDSLPVDVDGTYTVSWQEKNPNANPEKFQLDELTGLNLHTDDAEAGSSLWVLDGFTVSTARSHSTSHSYKSRNQNSDVSTMTTTTPLPVTPGMKFSFWCWYNEENNYDYAFVEVSRDGRYYDKLDGFTGSSGGWLYKEYSLANYTNDSVFIRIRAVTDDYTLVEGFYIDDMYPVPTFNSTQTLSNTITEHHYDITGKIQGDYYYRVMGYNTAKGWGDFSTLRKVIVSNITNEPPDPPTINGPTTGKVGTRYIYSVVSTDPDGNDVFYFIDWGDGTNSSWIGPYASAQTITANHTWSAQGTYVIKAKARDSYGAESSWSTLSVKMPMSLPFLSFWQRLFERFPNAFPILRHLLGY